MLEGYDALRQGAAWMDFSARGRLWATGRDCVRLLHNLTTNHIRQLTPGAGCYAFLLTPQGRIQADVNVLCLPDRFLLDTEPEMRERLPGLIRKYVIADDVKLEDAGGEMAAIGVEGPRAAAVLAAAGLPLPETDYSHLPWEEGWIANLSDTGQPGFRIFIPAPRRDDVVACLERAGAAAAAPGAARVVRLENGKPRYGEDIFETTLPQETRQLHAIHFNKGCYLGQEIVERIRARGHVNRLLVKLTIDAPEPPPAGTKLQREGEEAGEITSAAFSPTLGASVALAYARAPYAEPGTTLSAGDHTAVVR